MAEQPPDRAGEWPKPDPEALAADRRIERLEQRIGAVEQRQDELEMELTALTRGSYGHP